MEAWTKLGRRLYNLGICTFGAAAAVSFSAIPIIAENDKEWADNNYSMLLK